MGDLEAIKRAFDENFTNLHANNWKNCRLLFHSAGGIPNSEELGSLILKNPVFLNNLVRWSAFEPLLRRHGFNVSRRDLADFAHYFHKSPDHFNSPLYSIFHYLSNPIPEDFSLEQFL